MSVVTPNFLSKEMNIEEVNTSDIDKETESYITPFFFVVVEKYIKSQQQINKIDQIKDLRDIFSGGGD